MAVTAHVPPLTIVAMSGTTAINLTSDTLTAALCTGALGAWATGTMWGRKFASDFITALTAEIGTVGTYTAGYAGRVAVTSPTFLALAATNDNVLSFNTASGAAIAFGGGSASISAASMFINDKTAKSSAADASSYVITVVDFGATVSSTSGAYTYTPSTTTGQAGLVYFTCS